MPLRSIAVVHRLRDRMTRECPVGTQHPGRLQEKPACRIEICGDAAGGRPVTYPRLIPLTSELLVSTTRGSRATSTQTGRSGTLQ